MCVHVEWEREGGREEKEMKTEKERERERKKGSWLVANNKSDQGNRPNPTSSSQVIYNPMKALKCKPLAETPRYAEQAHLVEVSQC